MKQRRRVDQGAEMGVGRYLVFFVSAVLVSGLFILLGGLLTWNRGGWPGILALAAGCGVTLVAAAAGIVPLKLAAGSPPRDRIWGIYTATGVRFVFTLVGSLALVWSGWFEPVPLLLWVAASYLVLLVLESLYALKVMDPQEEVRP